MKKLVLALFVAVLTCNFVSAKDNYGFIDLPYILSKYQMSVSINKSIAMKEAEIARQLKDANAKIAAAKDATTKKTLEANAKKQLQPKLDSLVNYKKQQNLKIQTNINNAINKVAQKNNYALILNGNSVAYGATNVSDLVLNELNQK